MESKTCFLCRRPSCSLNCDKCNVSYCSERHRILHQDQVTGKCFPFKIDYREKIGRCLVANQDLPPGALVFKEDPVVVGPLHDAPLESCLGCFRPCQSRCQSCALPLCTWLATCTWRDFHLRLECQVMAQVEWTMEDHLYQCILPLRCLLTKELEPAHWAAIEAMMDHVEEKRQAHHWKQEKNVQHYLACRLGNRFSQEEVDHVVGVLEVNAFEVTSRDGHRGRGLYPLTALMSHSCLSNTRYIFQAEPAECRVEARTNVAVRQGQELVDHYVSPLNGGRSRRSALKEGWCFDCQCQRCVDPSEVGTNFSSAICQSCNAAIAITALATTCQSCGAKQSPTQLMELEQDLEASLEVIQNNKEALQIMLSSYSPILHTNHYLMVAAKRYLLYQLGFDDPLRVALAQQILQVYNVITPGLTKERGLTLFEVHAGLLRILRSDLRNAVSAEQAKTMLKQIQGITSMGISARLCLQFESPHTFEGSVKKRLETTLSMAGQIQKQLEDALGSRLRESVS